MSRCCPLVLWWVGVSVQGRRPMTFGSRREFGTNASRAHSWASRDARPAPDGSVANNRAIMAIHGWDPRPGADAGENASSEAFTIGWMNPRTTT